MSNKPVGQIIEGAKKYVPKVGKYIVDNHKALLSIASAVGLGKGINKIKEKKEESNKDKGKRMHYRKMRYKEYTNILLPELDFKIRNDLHQYTIEIERFIQQIKKEEEEGLGIKKTIHEKRIKEWNNILIQVKDKMATKDYLEYIKLYNNPAYESLYFKGLDAEINNFNKLNNCENHDNLLSYIAEKTNRGIEQVKKDFPLIY